MSRVPVAIIAGSLGFLLYVGAVVAAADLVPPHLWLLRAAYFVVVGVAWVWPASRLMYWAARREPPRRGL